MNIIDAQARDAVLVTKSDVNVHDIIALYVGGTGDVSVITEAEYNRKKGYDDTRSVATVLALCTTVLFSAVPVGSVINLRIKQVRSTLTTATLMTGFLP